MSRHPEITKRDYLRLPELLRDGESTLDDQGRSVTFLGDIDSRQYKAVVKKTDDGNYLTTFHRIRGTDLARAARRATRGT